MNTNEVISLQRLVETYWQLFSKDNPEDEPPDYFIDVVDYLEREHHLLFNTYSHRWIET